MTRGSNNRNTSFADYKSLSKESCEPVSTLDLFRFSSRCDKILAAVGSVSAIFGGAIQPFVLFIGGKVTGLLLSPDDKIKNDKFFESILYYVLLLFLLFILESLFTFAQVYFLRRACDNTLDNIKQTFLRSLLSRDSSWFDRKSSGEIVAQMNECSELYANGVGDVIGLLLASFSMFFSSIVTGLLINWKITVVMVPVGPLAALIIILMKKMLSSDTQQNNALSATAGGILEEAILNVSTVAACNGQQDMLKKYKSSMDKCIKFSRRFNLFSAIFLGTSACLNYVMIGFALWYSCYLYYRDEVSDPGDIFAIINAIGHTAYVFTILGPQILAILQARVACATLYEVIDEEIDSITILPTCKREIQGELSFEDVVFRYPTRENAVLKGLSWRATTGEIIALVGKSGCGKSTTVSLLTKDYSDFLGKILLDGQSIKSFSSEEIRKAISVVEQTPRLFNCSILDNILLGRDIPYSEAVEAAKIANAHEFISRLPQGYGTCIGPNGSCLSGGQQQRIAIARAIVAQPKILLLDEATSALDYRNERIILNALQKSSSNRTTIIVAHRLSTLKRVDRIVLIEDGVVKEEGTYEEFLAKDGIFAKSVQSELIGENICEPDRDWNEEKNVELPDLIPREPSETKLEEKSSGGLWMLLTTESKGFRGVLIFGLLAAVLHSSKVLTHTYSFPMAFKALQANSTTYQTDAILAFAFNAFTGLLSQIFYPIESVLSGWAAAGIVNNVCSDALQSLLHKDMSYFDCDEHSKARCASAIAQHAPNVMAGLDRRMTRLVVISFGLLAMQIISFTRSYQFGLFGIVSGAAIFALVVLLMVKTYRSREIAVRQDKTPEMSLEMIEQAKTIQLLGAEEFFLSRFKDEQSRVISIRRRMIMLESLNYSVSQSFVFLSDIFCYLLAGWLIYYGQISPYDAYFAMAGSQWTAWYIVYVSPSFPDMIRATQSAKLLLSFVDRKKENYDHETGLKPPIYGAIDFRNVNFSYRGTRQQRALRGFYLHADKGESIGLVGPSGGGKSTVISLLERFYLKDGGDLTIDRTDIDRFDLRHMRENIALVGQQPVLFEGTIIENVLLGTRGLTRKHAIKACQLANAAEFIEYFPKSYDTDVGHGGGKLSGGQRQRISIARAIVRNPKILLLDEATSALDTHSEEIVQKALNDARNGRTCIIVAHRLNSVHNCSRIGYVENGSVVECGPHEELLKRNGKYASLVKLQNT